ncbi:single-stranded DNA-binding protein [Rhodococcus marinonascens]|uniref:single-stranded DNA-binding protein n=1 Tax=Rhodococcus marinonascens TaxID=38311 RepID=UPI000A02ADAE|nr:single-stranded DNA-binding protein [Rhodococcus marinonascens]
MYETHGTVVGTVITGPVARANTAGEEFLSFRMVSTVRRRDFTTGEWRDGSTLYLAVTCRRRLMAGVVRSIAKGDPVIVTGELRTTEYTTRDGIARSGLELSATAIGPDLSRCVAVVERERRKGSADAAQLDTAPDDTAPDDTAPDDTAPDDTAPGDTAPDDTAPDDTAHHDTAPEDTAVTDAETSASESLVA